MSAAVNTTARLASAASAGEILVSGAAKHEAGLEDVELRILALKGKAEPMDAFVVRVPSVTG